MTELAAQLGERGGEFSLTVSDGALYIELGGATLTTTPERLSTT